MNPELLTIGQLPADAVALIEATAREKGVTPEEILAGACGHAVVLAPDVVAERIRAVEKVAGLPAGTIAGRIFCALAEEWIQGGPGALARWIEERFEFTGEPEEKAAIGGVLYRLEASWRGEASETPSPILG